MASVFDTIRQAAGDRDLSINWYKKKVADLSNRISAARLMRDNKLKKAPSFNKLHFFRYDPKLKAILPYYDTFPLVMPIQSAPGGFLGINFHYLPIPVDKNIEKLKIYENNNQINDVFFSMSHGVNRGKLKRDKQDERHNFITDLISECPNIIFDIYGYKNREPVWAEDFYKVIVNSKMALNLTRGKPLKYLTSNRIASLIGNGLLTFIDKRTQLSNFFNNNEVIFYSGLEDLANKINFYKSNDQKRINVAKKGRKKYFDLFECQKVANYIISKSFNREISKKLKWMD